MLNELQNLNSHLKPPSYLLFKKFGIWVFKFCELFYFVNFYFSQCLNLRAKVVHSDASGRSAKSRVLLSPVEPSPPLKPGVTSNNQTYAWTHGLLPWSSQYEDQHTAKMKARDLNCGLILSVYSQGVDF